MLRMNTLTQSLISNVYDLMEEVKITDIEQSQSQQQSQQQQQQQYQQQHQQQQQYIDERANYLKDRQQQEWLYMQNNSNQQQGQQQQHHQHRQHIDLTTPSQYQMNRSSSSSDSTSTNASPSPLNSSPLLSYQHLIVQHNSGQQQQQQQQHLQHSGPSLSSYNNNNNNNNSNNNNNHQHLYNSNKSNNNNTNNNNNNITTTTTNNNNNINHNLNNLNQNHFNSLTSLNINSNLHLQQMDTTQQQQQHQLLQSNASHTAQVNSIESNNNDISNGPSSVANNHNMNNNNTNNHHNSNNINNSNNNNINNNNNNNNKSMLNATISSLQQQQQQQQSASATAITVSGNTVAANAGSTSTSTSLTHHQQHQHQHSHQHAPGSTSPYKTCWCFGDSTYHMKILVPAVASGAIIGKGGETIASLQKDTGARVKMSKSHDFYPGTTERICLITGTVEGIMTVLDFIMDKIREKPDLSNKILDSDTKQAQERDKQVKILVPNSTAGMIIGKGGAYIKQIKEESGSYVQISQKPKDISLQERCITIIGDKENNKNACKMILSKIVEDPQSGTCLNVSYADVSGPVANFNPTGSPYATNQNAINSSTASLNSTLGTTIGSAATAAGLLVNGTGINLSLNLGSPNPAPNLAIATQLLEHIKVALRGSGYTETATTEVCAALGVLAKYGVLGMGVGLPHTNGAHATLGSYLGVSTLDQQTAAATAASAGNVFGAVGQVNLEQYNAAAAAVAAAAASRPAQTLDVAAAAAQFDPFRHLGTAAATASTPVSLNSNSFGLTAATGAATTTSALGATAHTLTGLSKSPTPGDLSAKDSKNVEIPEVIVGAILGPNGRSLVEIQHISGANVQISKKGIFAPGTRNRIVTITGQPSAIAKAQILIEQKISEEETKRARQIPLTTVVN